MATTSNRGNPYPTDSDVVDVPADIQALAEALDNAPLYDQGPYSSLGSAVRGKLFRTSEDGLLHVSDGSTWGAIGKVPVVTGLPGSPVDGQEVLYVANSTTREKWHLRYDSGKAGSYKWEVISAKPLHADGGASGILSATYTALSPTVEVALPLAGDYLVALGGDLYPKFTGSWANVYLSYQVGATAAQDADAVRLTNLEGGSSHGTAQVIASVGRTKRKTGLAAVTLALRARADAAGTPQVTGSSWLQATPLWVG